MVKIKGLVDKIPKKKLNEVYQTVKRVIETNGLQIYQKKLLTTDHLNTTKVEVDLNTDTIKRTKQTVRNSKGNVIVDTNNWNLDKIRDVIHERNEKIFILEKELLKLEYSKPPKEEKVMVIKPKIIKIEVDFSEKTDSIFNEFSVINDENFKLRGDLINYQTNYQDELRIIRNESEKLKYENEILKKKIKIFTNSNLSLSNTSSPLLFLNGGNNSANNHQNDNRNGSLGGGGGVSMGGINISTGESFSKIEDLQNSINYLNEKLLDSEAKETSIKNDKTRMFERNQQLNRQLDICENRLKNSLKILGMGTEVDDSKEGSGEDDDGDDIMKEELKNVSEAYDELLTQNKDLINKMSNLRIQNRDLEHEIIGIRNQLKNKMRIDEQIESNKKKIEIIKKEIESNLKNYTSKFSQFEIIEKEYTEKIDYHKKIANSYQIDLRSLEKKLSEVLETSTFNLDELNSIRNKYLEIEKDKKFYKIKAETYENIFLKKNNNINKSLDNNSNNNNNSNNKPLDDETGMELSDQGTGVLDLYREVENLREYVLCPLCKVNFKGYVLDKCMHCFCNDCLHDRLKSRIRNCPKCNVVYSKENIKKIYF